MKQSVIILTVVAALTVGCNAGSKKTTETANAVIINDTVFINQNLEINNLKFGKSTTSDFEIFRKNSQLSFIETHSAVGYADVGITDSCGKIIGKQSILDMSIYFENEDAGLKFTFAKMWEENTQPEHEAVLVHVTFNRCAKFKFYNGITFQSTQKEAINAFSNFKLEYRADDLISFAEGGIYVNLSFQDNLLNDVNITSALNAQ